VAPTVGLLHQINEVSFITVVHVDDNIGPSEVVTSDDTTTMVFERLPTRSRRFADSHCRPPTWILETGRANTDKWKPPQERGAQRRTIPVTVTQHEDVD